ncbi:hypothetical protein C8A06_0806 [Microbacteriaceae bacterium MWH-Ta3]|nr:hypothetical protein C8A06_0806 [Microbacteriaceae bacterium MWH-Ta3]
MNSNQNDTVPSVAGSTEATHTTATAEQTLKGIRRIVVWVIIVSLVITALIGIVTLLSGGEFGEIQGKTLLSTLAIAGYSITALCHLAIIGRDVRAVGWAGIAASAVGLAAALTLVWWNYNTYEWAEDLQNVYMTITKVFAISTITAVSFAHANLMLLLSNAPRQWMRVALSSTLLMITLVAVMVFPPILTDGEFPGETVADVYWRLFGVIAILDALGTIALPVTALILRTRGDTDDQHPEAAVVRVTLRGDLAARVIEGAEAAQLSATDYVESELQKALAQSKP